ncbi:MAG: J domain-containing protein [Polyangiaceae bacterium]|nr:J domain-containing protein [Polyangiaceae bacterium]
MVDYYALLGVSPLASRDQIARAYRRRTVSRHRARVIQLEDQLRAMREAFEILSDPDRRSAYDAGLDAARLPEQSAEDDRLRREGQIRVAAAREIGVASERIGRQATAENAAAIRALAEAHDARERHEARSRRRRAMAQRIAKVVWVAALTAAGWYLLGRLG